MSRVGHWSETYWEAKGNELGGQHDRAGKVLKLTVSDSVVGREVFDSAAGLEGTVLSQA